MPGKSNRGIPARMNLLERRIEDIEELIIKDGKRVARALREVSRTFVIALETPKRLALLEDRVTALEAKDSKPVSKPRG